MIRLFFLLLSSSIVLLVTVIIFYIILEPVEVGVSNVGKVRVPQIDFSDFDVRIEIKDYFQPLMADTSDVIRSMMEAGVEATSVAYKGYFKIDDMEYAVLETQEGESIVRVGDYISQYVVYGIAEFAVLLNDLNSNSFAISRIYEEKK